MDLWRCGGRRTLWRKDEAQDIAEYAMMLAVILVIIIGTIRLIGSNSNNVFSAFEFASIEALKVDWGRSWVNAYIVKSNAAKDLIPEL